jgi:hypothetical protein
MFLHRSGLVIGAVSVALLSLPSLANATDFCVHNDPCVQQGGTAFATLEDALGAAEAGQSADRIFLGTGTFTAPTTAGFTAPMYPVEIIGQGSDQTALTAPPNATPVLALGNDGSTVSDLMIVSPDAPDHLPKTALSMTGGTAGNLLITAADGGSDYVTGAALGGTRLEDSTINLPTNHLQIAVKAGTDTQIRRDVLTGAHGIDIHGADVQIDRTRITAQTLGIYATRLNTVMTDSLIRLTDTGTGVQLLDAGGATVTATLRNDTIVGPGASGDGIAAVSTVAGNVTAIVQNTVIRGFGESLYRWASAPGTATIAMLYSDWDPFSAQVGSGNGSLLVGAGNISGDPLFAGSLDFHLGTGSPAIDAGDPTSYQDTLDLDGNPRVVNGRRDIGAFEAQPAAPAPAPTPAAGGDPAPTGTATPATTADPGSATTVKDLLAPTIAGLKITPARFTLRHGASLAFRLSERATVTVTLKRRAAHNSKLQQVAALRRATAAGATRIAIRKRFAGKQLRAGRYVATVAATDAAGNRSRATQVSFTVVRG